MTTLTPLSALPSPEAGGNIATYRFVEASTSADFTVTQANAAGDRVVGVTTGIEKYAPGSPGAVAGRAAEAGDTVELRGWGEIALLELGTGGATRFVGLVPDSDGKGVAVGATGGSTFHAIALEAGSAGDIIRVWVCPPNQLTVV